MYPHFSAIKLLNLIVLRYSIAVPWDNTVQQIDKIQCDWERIIVGCENGELRIFLNSTLVIFVWLDWDMWNFN